LERQKIRRYVVDASVAVKWFVTEEDSTIAFKVKESFVKGTFDLLSPSLLKYEVANALRFHPIVRLPTKMIAASIAAIEQMQLLHEPTVSEWTKAAELSVVEDISIYDSVYISVATTHRATLLTSDLHLHERLSEETRKHVMMLDKLM